MRKKQLARCLAGMICLLLLINRTVWAGIDPPVIKVLDGSLNQIQVDSLVMVEDAKFFDPGYDAILIKPYRVQNKVFFQIRESANVLLQSSFTASVQLRIKFTRANSTVDSVDKTLSINYDGSATYTNKSVFLLGESAYRLEVKVLSRSTNVGWDVWDALEVINELTSVPQYEFSCTNDAIEEIGHAELEPDDLIDELPVSWPNSLVADEYDLEWAWIDSSALASNRYGNPATPDPVLLFDNNASRVTIRATSYNIPLMYDGRGTLFFRVRPVQWEPGGGRFEANWSSGYTGGLGRFEFYGHERSINWQATTSFAEEGKRKTVIQYYDGSLRGRQTVTKDNSTGKTIVAESFYDYQGRPVIQVLPAPTLNTVIQFSHNFNIGLNGSEYDKDNYDELLDPAFYCNSGAAAMKADSGAARYYSPSNPEKNTGFHQYIPDAEGYPFTEVEYTPDNTGRISRQSGVGPMYKLGSGHETKYYYGSPSQRELDALFGTEAGDASHYFKTMVRDANGQFSVSYTDMHGRTVATALAGTPPDSIKLDLLPSHRTDSVTEVLSDPDFTIIRDLVMETKKSLLVARPGFHTFNYSLNPQSLLLDDCDSNTVCYDCLYDLEIIITDDCNNQKLGGQPFDTLFQNFSIEKGIDTTCTAADGFSVSFTRFLDAGSYDITKKLSISRYGADYYRDSVFMERNNCKTLEQFINEQRELLAGRIECQPSCQSCRDSLDSWEDFRSNFMVQAGIAPADSADYREMALSAYTSAVADCDALCGDVSDFADIRNAMLADMTAPSGQYANLDSLFDPYSIFYTDQDEGDTPDTLTIYTQVTNYLDENGGPALVYDESTGTFVEPFELSPETFSVKFQASWAEALLPYHPEYCKLQVYEALKASFEWDRRFEAVETFREAIALGYLNPTDGSSSAFTKYNGFVGSHPDPDPIIDYVPNNFTSELEPLILQANITGEDVDNYSLWAVANMTAICVGANSTPACYDRFADPANVFDSTVICQGDLDMAWRIFRQLYLGIKKERIGIWLNSTCASTPSAATLTAAGHHPHFGSAEEMFGANGVTLPTDPGELSAFVEDNINAANAYYDANCEAYVEQWWYQLKPCHYNSTDSAAIIPLLIQVCKEGSDATHIYGASSVRPSSTYTYRSFDEVITAYNEINYPGVDSYCNAFLITSPGPYDQQVIYSDKPVWARPDSCECDRIASLKNDYQAVSSYYTSFSDYLSKRYHTTVSTGLLDSLSAMCTGTFGSDCYFMEQPYYLPPVFQCNSGDVCVNCMQVKTLDEEFRGRYPGVSPVIDPLPADSAQIQHNQLYEQFMNYKLGFAKTVFDYLVFLDSCENSGYIDSSVCVYEQQLSFNKTYAVGSQNEWAYDLHETFDGGYIMAGEMDSNTAGGFDAYVVKTDNQGEVEWAKTYGDSYDQSFSRIRQTADSGYIAIGTTYTNDHPEIIVVRLNKNGNIVWSKILGTTRPGGEKGEDIIETSDGKFALVGGALRVSFRYGGLWVVALLDESGNLLWDELISNDTPNIDWMLYSTYSRASLLEDDTTLVVAGGTPAIQDPADISAIKLSKADGSLIWAGSYSYYSVDERYEGYLFGEEIYKIDGGYRIGGTGGEGDPSITDKMHFILDIDRDGDPIVSRVINIPDAQYSSVYSTADGGFIAVQSDGMSSISGTGVHLTKVDATGVHQWTNTLIDDPIDRVKRVIQRKDGSFAVVGIDGSEKIKLIKTWKNGATQCNDEWEVYELVEDTLSEKDPPFIDRALILDNSAWSPTTILQSVSVDTFCLSDSLVCSSYSSNIGPTLCGRSEPAFPPVTIDSIDNCTDTAFFAISIGTELYTSYRDSLTGQFDSLYRAKCLQAYKYESFTVSRKSSEYHYTLYYYDQAGNLVKTIPPEGVDISKIGDTGWEDEVRESRSGHVLLAPDHRLATQYRYNTLNQVVAQASPDGGTSHFWYDRLGRLVVSQNAQQLTESTYSYTVYDALGRITGVGQKPQGTAMTQAISRDNDDLDYWLTTGDPKEQITRTVYDVSYFDGDDLLAPEQLVQRNLRNRVSYTQVFDTEPYGGNYTGTHRAATYYSYDIHGNVDSLLQDYNIGVMESNGNRFKKIAYNYDLISGKVNLVAYQWRMPDQFFHLYEYDAENRLTAVYTSADSIIWEKDARYAYYRHGPLARTVLGEQQVQGLDYAYTVQGWLKGINSTSLRSTYDMGGDGLAAGLHQYVGRDAFSISLNYFEGEYKPINSGVTPFPAYKDYLATDYRPLYNGNISSMTVNIGQFNQPLFNNYQYDQLNRIIAMDVWVDLDEPGNSWDKMSLSPDYTERVSYDANGNIKAYERNGFEASGNVQMDQLTYHYNMDGSGHLVNNRLRHVSDEVDENNYTEDIDNQEEDNYSYDEIGNLISDQAEHINAITWTVYGKIARIEKDGGTTVISYTYDAGGNRISKTVAVEGGSTKHTWYVRDASGNVMSVYQAGNTEIYEGELTQVEVHLYGSSRLGIFNVNRNVENPDVNTTGIYTFERGKKFFELSNHLGNVLVTISDKKLGQVGEGGGVDYYLADVVTANDYYPGGMDMPGRQYSATTGYRYGFNGKEKDTESPVQYDYGFRIYDPRLVRFKSVDPLAKSYPWNSTYAFAENDLIRNVDLDGEEKKHYLLVWDEKHRVATLTFSYEEDFYELTPVPGISNMSSSSQYSRGDMQSYYKAPVYENKKNPSVQYIVHGDVEVPHSENGMFENEVRAVTWTFKTSEEMFTAEKQRHKGFDSQNNDEPFEGSSFWGYASSDQRWDIAWSQVFTYSMEAQAQKTVYAPNFAKVSLPKWKGPVDYSKLIQPRKVGPGLKTTPAQRQRILEYNKKMNGGILRSDIDGSVLDMPVSVPEGGKANMNQAEVDHVIERVNGGSNSNSNLRVISKDQNLKKESQRRRG